MSDNFMLLVPSFVYGLRVAVTVIAHCSNNNAFFGLVFRCVDGTLPSCFLTIILEAIAPLHVPIV